MHIFYVQNIAGNIAILEETDSRHCILVLRMRKGDSVNLTDGKGGFYEGVIDSVNHRAVTVEIIKKEQNYGKKEYYLHVAIAPTKNIDRFEWFLEKATEIGIDEITPLLCRRSERENLRNDRLEKILVSAIKQSIKAYLPVLNPMTGFDKFISGSVEDNKYIALCSNDKRSDLIKVHNHSKTFTILIGPEGDFSQEETESAIKNGFIPVSLGASRLRTETAGIAACQIISDWNTIHNLK
jgi:16S rRNA (uracil1498-N3)-methyltransferase